MKIPGLSRARERDWWQFKSVNQNAIEWPLASDHECINPVQMSRSPMAKEREREKKERNGRRRQPSLFWSPSKHPELADHLFGSLQVVIDSRGRGRTNATINGTDWPFSRNIKRRTDVRPGSLSPGSEYWQSSNALFYQEEGVGAQRRIQAPGPSWEAWWVIPG